MKKFICFLLCLSMLIMAFGCDSNDSQGSNDENVSSTASENSFVESNTSDEESSVSNNESSDNSEDETSNDENSNNSEDETSNDETSDDPPEQTVGNSGLVNSFNHQTPDNGIPLPEDPSITPLRAKVIDAQQNAWRMDTGELKCSGLKVWICDENKRKIDYTYTNKNGIAAFDVKPGKYTIYFEGNKEFLGSYYHETLVCEDIYKPGINGIKTYKIYSCPIKRSKIRIYACDAKTKQPLVGARVAYTMKGEEKTFGFTDDTGWAEIDSPLVFYHNQTSAFYPEVTDPLYDREYTMAAVYEKEFKFELETTSFYNISIKCIDAKTGDVISGVVAADSNPSDFKRQWDSRTHFSEKSDENGLITGVITSDTRKRIGTSNVKFTYSVERIVNGETIIKSGSYECRFNNIKSGDVINNFVLTVRETENELQINVRAGN